MESSGSTKFSVKKVFGKKLKKGTYYKFFVVAFDAAGHKLASSKTVHVATSGGKAGNYKSVKLTNVKKNKLTLKKGKSFQIRAKQIVQSKKLKVSNHRKLAYESSNTKVAKVSGKGKIKAVSKGKCTIYVYSQSGVFAKIKVIVK